MYSNTLKWKSPHYKEKEERQARNMIRNKFCKDSFAWDEDLELQSHRDEMTKLYDEYESRKAAANIVADTSSFIMRTAMDAKTMQRPSQWTTNHSTVLAQPTIFIPPSECRSDDFAAWPTFKEMFNEGDDRIQKDQKIHLRLLAIPRTSGNDTVAILLRRFLDPLFFDDFKPALDEESVMMRAYHIGELEFDDNDGRNILGTELMVELDPVGRL